MLYDAENDRMVSDDILCRVRYRLNYLARLDDVSDADYEIDCIGNSDDIEEDFDTLDQAKKNAPSDVSYMIRRICCHRSEDVFNAIFWSVIDEDPVVEV